jgi:dihydroorotate dehydrogenase (NAD+) catalytic subunit
MGGVATGRDALELLAAGANDIALGTILFSDPAAPGRVRAELEAELAAHGFASADNAVGAAHEGKAPTLDSESRLGVEKDLHLGANVAG